MATTTATNEPHNDQRAIILWQALFASIALVAYLVRLGTRVFMAGGTGADDYIMGVAMMLSIGLSVADSLGTQYGWGRDAWTISPKQYTQLAQIGWLNELIYTLCVSAVKLSILFLYKKLLASSPTYRKFIWAGIVFVALWCVAFTCVVIFQCTPIEKYWDPNIFDRSHCIVPNPPMTAHGVLSIITDLYVYFLPMPMLWQLRISTSRRISLACLFGAGALTCIAGGIRLYWSIIIESALNPTIYGLQLWTWQAVEINLAIVCASIPGLKPLCLYMFPLLFSKIFGSLSNRSDPTPPSYPRWTDERLSTPRGGRRNMHIDLGKNSEPSLPSYVTDSRVGDSSNQDSVLHSEYDEEAGLGLHDARLHDAKPHGANAIPMTPLRRGSSGVKRDAMIGVREEEGIMDSATRGAEEDLRFPHQTPKIGANESQERLNLQGSK